MKEWITPILVVIGLVGVGFGIRAVILKKGSSGDSSQEASADSGSSNGPEVDPATEGVVSLTPHESRDDRDDPDSPNDWHNEQHPFVGYPTERAPLDEIKITSPKDQPEHAVDDMVTIPAGEFTMGVDDFDIAKPKRRVFVDAFRIDRYEITNAQYRAFIKETDHPQPELRDEWAKDYSWREKEFPRGTANRPVSMVTMEDARTYCKWTGKRLPTEEEWEKAARGTEGNIYPWGNDWDGRKAHTVERFSGPLKNLAEWKTFEEEFDDDALIHPWPVGSYGGDKSPFGVMDMHGNVSEWVDTPWDTHDGGDETAHALFGKKDMVVVKGNSFANRDYAAPAWIRYVFDATYVEDTIGFRCASDL